jgi:alpha-galactosidase
LLEQSFHHLHQAGVSLLIDLSGQTIQLMHFGRALGQVDSIENWQLSQQEPVAHAELDEPIWPGLHRENSRGNIGRPSLLGHRSGLDWSPKFLLTRVDAAETFLTAVSQDTKAGLEITSKFKFVGAGVLEISQTLKNIGNADYFLDDLSVILPLPDQVSESMDFAGRWVKERQPHRRQIQPGMQVREVREGRSSHDYTIIQMAMTQGANYQQGEIWSLGLMFSGNSRHFIERQQSGRTFLAAGELLLPGEVILKPGESYSAPSVAASYSANGFDEITNRHYDWLRSRPNHPKRPRPLTLNVWEAVYFDHNLEKLSELADVAKQIGVERFVLDDGWFGSRRSDSLGLGDWVVSNEVWPNGLGPLIEKVKSCGMEFGLWFEGEMVNPDSDLYRAHPDWILKIGDRVPPLGRLQHVLDITNPDAFEHVLNQTDAVLNQYEISYIKWDHNKFLIEPGHQGKAAVREQTLAIYRLFDELKLRHPGLEIESCSSGGGRVDLGMVSHADRFWTSDCNDALERQHIQRYTQFAIPPELLGSHIGPTHSHTTGRTHDLSFRAITALFGHAGLEWDLTQTTAEEREVLRAWANYYKTNRELLHTGTLVRVDQQDDAVFVHGVVSKDKTKGIFAWVTLSGQAGSRPNAIRFEGLDQNKNYHLKAVYPAGEPRWQQRQAPSWLFGVTLSGAALSGTGVRSPIVYPEQALLIEIEAI